MRIKGIKRGQTIELKEELKIPDGQEILIEVKEVKQMSDEEMLQKMKYFLENPRKGRKELVATLNQLDRERHAQKQAPKLS